MKRGFRDSTIYIHGLGFRRACLSLSPEGRIISFESVQDSDFVVPNQLFVVPGFIDEHLHGSDGFDVMDGKRSSLETIAKALPRDGVTSFCPTTMTMSEDRILGALRNIEDAVNNPFIGGARIIGAHLEGPFISSVYKGAQEARYVRRCDPLLMARFFAACPHVKMVTFAYEENGKQLLSFLNAYHIVPSIGHSNCTSLLLKEGIDTGITCSTHTFNAMSPFKHREVGVVGRVLIDDRVNCELIADMIHVSQEAIQLLYRCKKDRIVLITDSMEAKHLEDGVYSLGGQKVYVSQGAARLKDGTLAGSVLTTNKAIKNVKEALSIPLSEAVDMATLSPARNLHLENEIGSIEIGRWGDFTVIDEECNVYATFRSGDLIYKKEDYSWLR